MRRLVSAVMILALSGCSLLSAPKGCPDRHRLAHLTWPSKDAGDHMLGVDDCLSERVTNLAKGPSTDDAVARSAISYCGTYEWNGVVWGGADPADADKKEYNRAFSYAVEARAFSCPIARERELGKDLSTPLFA